MNNAPFHRDNHFVPRMYLKRFVDSHDRVSTYRTLVSNANVPLWKENSIGGVAWHSHLYTRIVAGRATDEIEDWLNHEFEAPADEALRKATADASLTPSDWHCLVRFLAAQDVRTPARLMECLLRWHATLPGLMEDCIPRAVQEFELAKRSGEAIAQARPEDSDYFPLRVTKEIKPGEDFGMLKCEILAGRSLWLFSIRHLLTETSNALLQHRWSILSPPNGLNWFTSDDPVIRLNFCSDVQYDFRGGWANPGTEILFPLSPHHLLYARVDHRPPPRGESVPRARAEMIRRFIAEHAHRMIFAASRDADVPRLRPRRISPTVFREENEHWRRWHEEQTAAERKLIG